MSHKKTGYMRVCFSRILVSITLLLTALTVTACFHVIQETTCKIKFKRKYNCRMKYITVVEDEMVHGDNIRLRGCGKTVTYDGTKEVLVEE